MNKFVTLGDPHLGRKFRAGVPLHRIGDREEMVWKDFRNSLMTPGDVDTHVCMGDLFDKFVVSPEVLLRAENIYRQAAHARQDVEFIVIRGNHDVSRDSTKRSSFDIFTQLVAEVPNITVVNDPLLDGDVAYIPYDPFIPVSDIVEALPDNLHTVFMHHDYTDFGGDQVIPTKLLANKGIEHVINGHDHLTRTETRHGVMVEITGSMQPYTHGEDPSGLWYQTHTLEDLEKLDPAFVAGLNIRLKLKEGESIPEDLDCLSVIPQRISEDDEGVEIDTTDFDTFDISTALSEAVHPDLREEIMEKFNAS